MTPITLTPAGYIVADGLAIYGTGATRDKAISDAREWMSDDDGDPVANISEGVSQALGRTYVAPATSALIDQVQNGGGDTAWDHWNGVCCTTDERDEAQDAHLRGKSGET